MLNGLTNSDFLSLVHLGYQSLAMSRQTVQPSLWAL